ncbi:MAG: tRNA (adenosine(37)-N6)-dimethylallyltransferase MiaA [Actinomycetota bacterium]|nr:tRNA (adenosine(37)-N6)-dimethylallyltransferase MiaA [Actinomycetota bacterium]
MPDAASPPPVVAVVGPTAAGKSDLAVDLAKHLGGEVVNGDSMQLYRGMDVGTAKIVPAQRRGVPHHLLDVLDVTEPATVAQFQRWARAAVDDCRRRGSTPVVVGGSALYMRAVLDRFEFPGTDAALRTRLEKRLAEQGAGRLHAELAEQDPQAAADILPSNGRRVVRALEVIALTGRPFSSRLPEHTYVYDDVRQVGIDVPRPVLDERIALRVEQMWSAGFVDEVRRLEAKGLREGRTAARALGYAQVLRFLAGEISQDEAREQTVRATRRFARRQDSWFRKDPRITWVGYADPALLTRALDVCA